MPCRCTSLLFQQSKFCHGLRLGRGPLVMCAYKPLQISLGLLTSYSGGILNGRWGGGYSLAENTHTNLHHLLCDSVEIPPTQQLALKYTHQHLPTTTTTHPFSSSHPPTPASVQSWHSLHANHRLKLKCQTTFHLQAVSHMRRRTERNTDLQSQTHTHTHTPNCADTEI